MISAPIQTAVINTAEIRRCAEFVVPLIGRPWVKMAEGPSSFDCWGLARHVQKGLFNRNLPEVDRSYSRLPLPVVRELFVKHLGPDEWEEQPSFSHGALVLMGSAAVPTHAGVFLSIPPGPGSVLHCREGYGVMFENIDGLTVAGFSRFRWYNRA